MMKRQFVVSLLIAALWLPSESFAMQTPATPPPVPQAAPPPAPAQSGDDNANISLRLPGGADLLQVVGIIADQLKMNYVVDPQVKGVVTINTTGDIKRRDLLPLLQAILRVNGATAVESNGIWRIIPAKDAPRAPVTPTMDGRQFPADDRLTLNVVPLRFASAGDMSRLLQNYLSDAGSLVSYEAGNILLITDTSRSLQRLMDLLQIFDSDAFAGQRVRLFPAKNSSAHALAQDLQTVFAAYAMSAKSPIQFLPIERLNGVLVISPNPASFSEVEKWVDKLDVATRSGGTRNYVYKVQNAKVEDLASVLVQLYGGYSPSAGSRSARSSTMNPVPAQTPAQSGGAGIGSGVGAAIAAPVQNPAPTRLAGTPQAAGMVEPFNGPRIVSDAVNNMLIVQCSPQEWEEIRTTVQELDIVPRQVLIEAKIFEVNLTGDLEMGVTALLQQRDNTSRQLVGSFSTPTGGAAPSLNGSIGTLVGHSRELLLFLTASENRTRSKVISAPSIMASDNIDAKIDVGTSIPILTSVGFTGAQQQGGGSIFTNSISNVDTGVILTVTPRINAGGLVTLHISQEVSVAGPPPSASIPSPTIQKRTVDTQVTVQDGETIALGGIIQESRLTSTNRIPILGDIPYLGALFGSTSVTTQRTELIVLITPHVIRDMKELSDTTEELKDKLKLLQKMFRQQP
jgi:general secretion pathway protein D